MKNRKLKFIYILILIFILSISFIKVNGATELEIENFNSALSSVRNTIDTYSGLDCDELIGVKEKYLEICDNTTYDESKDNDYNADVPSGIFTQFYNELIGTVLLVNKNRAEDFMNDNYDYQTTDSNNYYNTLIVNLDLVTDTGFDEYKGNLEKTLHEGLLNIMPIVFNELVNSYMLDLEGYDSTFNSFNTEFSNNISLTSDYKEALELFDNNKGEMIKLVCDNLYEFIDRDFDYLWDYDYEVISKLENEMYEDSYKSEYFTYLNDRAKSYGYESIDFLMADYKYKVTYENYKAEVVNKFIGKIRYCSDEAYKEIYYSIANDLINSCLYTRTYYNIEEGYNWLLYELEQTYLELSDSLFLAQEKERFVNYFNNQYELFKEKELYDEENLYNVLMIINDNIVKAKNASDIEELEQVRYDTLEEISKVKVKIIENTTNGISVSIESDEGLDTNSFVSVNKAESDWADAVYEVYFDTVSDNPSGNYIIKIDDDLSNAKKLNVYTIIDGVKVKVDYEYKDGQLLVNMDTISDIYVVTDYNPPYLAMAITFGTLFTLLVLALIFIDRRKDYE